MAQSGIDLLTGVYTSEQPPVSDGQYNDDSPASPFLCSLDDVYDAVLGVDFTLLQQAISQKQGYNCTDVNSLITTRIIPSVESEIEERCGQSFRPKQETRYMDGSGSNEMLLPFFPILSLDACEITALPGVTWVRFQRPRMVQSLGLIDSAAFYNDTDLLVEPHTGLIRIPPAIFFFVTTAAPYWDYTFIRGQNNIKVTWSYGYANPDAVPRALRRAAALMVGARILKLQGQITGEGMSSYSSENVSRMWGRTDNLPYKSLLADMDKEATKILAGFKRTFM